MFLIRAKEIKVKGKQEFLNNKSSVRRVEDKKQL